MHVPRTLLRALVVGAAAVAIIAPACAASADPSPSQIADQIEQESNNLEDTIEAYNGLGEEQKKTQALADEVTAKTTELQRQLTATQSDVQTIAAAAYRSRAGLGAHGLGTASLLLANQSTNGLMDQVATLKHINSTQQADINRYNATKAELDTQQKQFQDLLADQTKRRQELDSKKSTIEAKIKDLEALKAKAAAASASRASTSTSSSSGNGNKVNPPAVSGAAGKAVSFAYNHLGDPYVWGAEGPNKFDCSGLTMAAWEQAGVNLPHNAAQQWNAISHVSRSALAPGDLVFYRSLEHVAIYIGNDQVIHAPSTGDVVKVSSVDMMTPYGYGRP